MFPEFKKHLHFTRVCAGYDEKKGIVGCGFLPEGEGPDQMFYSFNFKKSGDNQAKLMHACNSWKTIYSHPLVCLINKFMPKYVYVYHSNERDLGGDGDGYAGLIEFRYDHEIIAASAPLRQ